MNVYSELLDLLVREPEETPAGLFGTLAAVSPLTVSFRREDIGRGLALLPCEAGLLILFFVEGVGG